MMQIVQADSQKENILVLINYEVNHDNRQVFDRHEHKASLSLFHSITHSLTHGHLVTQYKLFI